LLPGLSGRIGLGAQLNSSLPPECGVPKRAERRIQAAEREHGRILAGLHMFYYENI
jgi:hypothetical protein